MADQLDMFHRHLLGCFTTSWQAKSDLQASDSGHFVEFSAISPNWHAPCLKKSIIGRMGRPVGKQARFRRQDMSNFDLTRVATATVGALILSTLSVTAAVGPAHSTDAARTAYAVAQAGYGQANA